MVADLFRNFGKVANDVLRDDYDFTRKIKLKSKAPNGVTFTTESTMSDNQAILAKVAANFTHDKSGIVFKKIQVTTHGRVVAEAEMPNVFFKNLKLLFKLEDGSVSKVPNPKQIGILAAEFKQEKAALETEADFIGNNVKAAVGIAQENLLIGGHAVFNLDKSHLTEHNVGVSYVSDEYATTVTTKKNFTELAASFHHRISQNTVYAGVMEYDLRTAANTMTIGGRHSVNKDSTYAGKVDTNGIVSLLSIQRLRPFVTLTTSVQFNAKNLESPAHKFGIGLTLE